MLGAWCAQKAENTHACTCTCTHWRWPTWTLGFPCISLHLERRSAANARPKSYVKNDISGSRYFFTKNVLGLLLLGLQLGGPPTWVSHFLSSKQGLTVYIRLHNEHDPMPQIERLMSTSTSSLFLKAVEEMVPMPVNHSFLPVQQSAQQQQCHTAVLRGIRALI